MLAVICTIGACGEGEPRKADATCASGACASVETPQSASSSPDASRPPADAGAPPTAASAPALDASTASPSPDASASAPPASESSPAASAASPSDGTPLPCDVRQTLAERCWACHGKPLRYTAPMPLLTVEDFQKATPSDPSRTVAESASMRIRDAQRPMPPQPFAPIEGTALTSVETWLGGTTLAAGSATDDCPLPPPLDVTPPAAEGGTTTAPADPAQECVEIRAHGGEEGSAFKFDNAVDLYQCFEFASPFGAEDVYGVSFKPMIDDPSVIHHWLLYQHTDAAADRSSARCAQVFPQSTLVAAWGPGTGDMIMPDDVAMLLPASGYTLEVHYNGSGNDTSGLQVCYDREPRKNTAAMHWLGTSNILGTMASNVCRPTNTEPIYTLKHWPHMHLSGQRLTTVITRATGEVETWFDEPFDFQNQKLWDTDVVINPGDTIETTCTYSRPAIGGEGTNQEMCYDVVLAYPAGTLVQPGPGSGFGNLQCVN
jgi:hypothetical protein